MSEYLSTIEHISKTVSRIPSKFSLQPEVRDWQLFSNGAHAAGFNFFLQKEDTEPVNPEDYHYSISLPLPYYVSRALKEFEPFVLRSEWINLFFGESPKSGYQIRICSDDHHPKDLTQFGERIVQNLIQQFGYHRVLSLLRPRDYMVVGESVLPDMTVKINLRRWSLATNPLEEITILKGPQKEVIQFEINPEGILSFDLSMLEEENIERYYRYFTEQIGPRYNIPTNTKTGKIGHKKTTVKVHTHHSRGR